MPTTETPAAKRLGKKAEQQAAHAAATAAAAPVATEPVVTEPVAPPTPYTAGTAAPEAIVSELATDRITQVDPTFLSVKRGYNVRDFAAKENIEHVGRVGNGKDEPMTGLVDSISQNGIETPLDVFIEKDPDDGSDRVVIMRGESRLRAVMMLRDAGHNIPTVPVRLVAQKDEARTAADFITSNSGKVLSPLEQMEVLVRLRAAGITKPVEAGRMIGMSHAAVGNLVLLGHATPLMRDFIKDGYLSASRVIEALRGHTATPEDITEVEKKLARLVKRMKDEGIENGASKGKALPDAETGATSDARKEGIAFNRGTFNTGVALFQELLVLMSPAKDYQKFRGPIKTYLESIGAPLVSKETQKAVDAAASATAE